MSCYRVVSFLASLLLMPVTARLVTFDNTKPRHDVNGGIINAHDGTTQRFGANDLFYYHAMGYPSCPEPGKISGCPRGACSVYNHNNSVAVWASHDLSSGSWKMIESVYPSSSSGFPTCTYFRSQAVYNNQTKKYVLWLNVAGCAEGVTSKAYATATSSAPEGPFNFQGFVEVQTPTLFRSKHASHAYIYCFVMHNILHARAPCLLATSVVAWTTQGFHRRLRSLRRR